MVHLGLFLPGEYRSLGKTRGPSNRGSGQLRLCLMMTLIDRVRERLNGIVG